ncbi:MAG TPA: DUF1848 domain-containing protein [Clostridia bacterium]
MILSVSRRTDIPAFYTEWFFNRLKEGYVLVRNPMNYHQVHKIALAPEKIDCIVFWTKDPTNMLDKLDLLKDYNYYFLITVTPYDEKIEKNLNPKKRIIQSFQALSSLTGKNKTIWRYDPVLLTEDIDIDFHIRNFEFLASSLSGFTEKCVISFLDIYKKTHKNMRGLNALSPNESQMIETARYLSKIAAKYGIKLQTCCEPIDLSMFGIERGKCIDDRLIAEIAGKEFKIPQDKNQRDFCRCAESVDIGAYNSCPHGCLYSYANFSETAVNNNLKKHDPRSPMLIGNLEPQDVVIEKII